MVKHLRPINWIQWLTLALIPALVTPLTVIIIQIGGTTAKIQQARHDATLYNCEDINNRHDETVQWVNQQLVAQGQPKRVIKLWDKFIQDLVPKRNCSVYAQKIVEGKR